MGTFKICMLIAFVLCFCIGAITWVKSWKDDDGALHRISLYIIRIAIVIGIVLITNYLL